jgi:hypothetical protein
MSTSGQSDDKTASVVESTAGLNRRQTRVNSANITLDESELLEFDSATDASSPTINQNRQQQRARVYPTRPMKHHVGCYCGNCCRQLGICLMSPLMHFQTPIRKFLLGGFTLLLFTAIMPLIGYIIYAGDNTNFNYLWQYTFGLVLYSRQFDVRVKMAEESLTDVISGYVHTYYIYTSIGILTIFALVLCVLFFGYLWIFFIRLEFGYRERQLIEIFTAQKSEYESIQQQQQQQRQ